MGSVAPASAVLGTENEDRSAPPSADNQPVDHEQVDENEQHDGDHRHQRELTESGSGMSPPQLKTTAPSEASRTIMNTIPPVMPTRRCPDVGVGRPSDIFRVVVEKRERVLARIEVPDLQLTWQEWFRTLLFQAGPVVAEYPGVAKWMLMHGPTLPAALPVLEAGMSILGASGFGERAAFTYAVLLNSAMLTISMGDDRLQHEGGGPGITPR